MKTHIYKKKKEKEHYGWKPKHKYAISYHSHQSHINIVI